MRVDDLHEHRVADRKQRQPADCRTSNLLQYLAMRGKGDGRKILTPTRASSCARKASKTSEHDLARKGSTSLLRSRYAGNSSVKLNVPAAICALIGEEAPSGFQAAGTGAVRRGRGMAIGACTCCCDGKAGSST
jgi:hypothetical protein